MIKNHLSDMLMQKLGHEPTTDQMQIIDLMAGFIADYTDTKANPDKVFIIRGYAGTGKTSLIGALVKTLPEFKLKSVLLAPTGRAAKVLSNYSGQPASTIHKKIYRQKSLKDAVGVFALDKNLHKRTLFIVDEASMISNESSENSIFGSGQLLNDLLEFVYSGEQCKLILVGDTAQLPPVGLSVSPALNQKVIDEMGFTVLQHELSQVVRQSANSGILHNATLLRNAISESKTGYPHIALNKFADLNKIGGAELIEQIEQCYSEFGMNDTIIICRSNKRAYQYNEGIRRTILWRESELSKGDLLMVVKNNYFWLSEEDQIKTPFIANGDMVEVTRVGKYKELYGFRFADVSLQFLDYPDLEIEANIILDTLNSETASLSWEQNQQLFNQVMEDYAHLRTKRERIKMVKSNPFFNALQVKFGYAITCHKAQGGQWKSVFIDQGWLTTEMLDTEYLRWLYTAFTRPQERLYLVNFNKEFFE